MLLQAQRQQVVDIGMRIVRHGLAHDGQGNISVYDRRAGYIAISPTGLPYEQRQAQDICVVTPDGELVEGTCIPTSEHALHYTFYRARPDVNAVLHTHAEYATIFSITGKASMPVVLAEAGAMLGGPVPVAPYGRPGTQTVADVTVAAAGQGSAAIMANHGLVTVGPDLRQALKVANALESMAKAIVLAGRLTPQVATIDDEEVKILSAMYEIHVQRAKRE